MVNYGNCINMEYLLFLYVAYNWIFVCFATNFDMCVTHQRFVLIFTVIADIFGYFSSSNFVILSAFPIFFQIQEKS